MFDGTVRKRKDGRYELQIIIGKSDAGKPIRKSFYGHKEREVIKKKDDWLKEYLSDQTDSLQSDINTSNIIKFDEWSMQWLEIYKKDTVRPYTYQNTYKTRVEKYLIPYFKDRPLNSINNVDVKIFFNKHSNLSLSLLKTLRVILNDIFKKAINNGFIINNPVNDIQLYSTFEKKEKTIWDSQQQEKVINWSIQNKCLDILLAIKTGMRRSELMGLRWCDIDFDNRIIIVSQAISPAVNGIIDTHLKTVNSHRQIPFDSVLYNELKDNYNSSANISEYVLGYTNANAYGKYIERILKRISKECDVPYVTLHGIRHTYGTILREQGVDIYTISKLLGHSSIEVTASIYVHNDIEVMRQKLGI